MCAKEHVYNNNTSSMQRHYYAYHAAKEESTGPSYGTLLLQKRTLISMNACISDLME